MIEHVTCSHLAASIILQTTGMSIVHWRNRIKMKRFIGTTIAAAVATAAMGQAPFTIYRPKDEERVKERVVVQIPKNSIPDNSYVGIFLNDKFIEGTTLPIKGRFYEYVLDTKNRKIADGKYELRMVLYQQLGERVVVAGESKRTIHVANSSSIKVPSNGLLLRYRFRPGDAQYYQFEQRVNVSTITEAQARQGSRASLMELDSERFRVLYAVDNAYGNGDGLVRMQPAPLRGKDFAVLTTIGDEQPTKYMDYEMAPLYMRVTNTGLERFGAMPLYVPIEGSSGKGASPLDLYGSFPLPTLPSKRVRPGDSWQTRFQVGSIAEGDKMYDLNSVTAKALARGEFVGVEWEMGRACAKIKNSISGGALVPPGMAVTKEGMGRDKISVEQTYWIDIANGRLIKSIFDVTIDERVADAPPSGGAAGGGGMQGPSGPGGPGAGTAGAGAGMTRGDFQGRGRGGPDGEDQGGRPFGPGGQGGRPGGMGQGNTGGRTGGPAVGAIRFVRTRLQLTMVIDR